MKFDLTVRKNASNELVVDPEEIIVPEQAVGTHLLVWTLDPVTLPGAEFADEEVALEWQPPKPAYHIFRRGRVSPDKRVLTILDRNQDSQTHGDFEYKLLVLEPDLEAEDQVYATGVRARTSEGGTIRPITNPIIINR